MTKYFLLLFVIVLNCVKAEYKNPPPTYEAKGFTTWAKERVFDKSGSGAVSRKAQIHVPLTEDGSDAV